MKTFGSSLVLASLLALSAVTVGCGTYRVVQRTPNGGVVALEGTESKAREAAQEYMATQCPDGFAIVEEGEAVIGTETDAETQQRRVLGVRVEETKATTTDKREWRIKYQCRAPNAVAVAGGNQGKIQEIVVQF